MTAIQIIHGLPFIRATIEANNQKLELEYVLLDTGAAASVFKTDILETIGVSTSANDKIRKMTGVGGVEHVIEKQIDVIRVRELTVSPFTIQMGALDYGMKINGIIGSDFLLKSRAKINFQDLTISG